MGRVWRGLAVLTVVTGATTLLAALRVVPELSPGAGFATLFAVLLLFSLATAGCLRAARRADAEANRRRQPPPRR